MAVVMLIAIAIWFVGAGFVAFDMIREGGDKQQAEKPVMILHDINRSWAQAAFDWDADVAWEQNGHE